MWEVTLAGKNARLAIRTTQDRYIAFNPLDSGTSWKTLDDVELVAVAAVDAVDDHIDPQDIDVYLFEADHVRKHFNDAHAAKIADGQTVTDNFGMWVGLDADNRDIPASVGSGIAVGHEPIATFSMSELLSNDEETQRDGEPDPEEFTREPETQTIADVLGHARQLISSISGVSVDSVKLDCKIEYS